MSHSHSHSTHPHSHSHSLSHSHLHSHSHPQSHHTSLSHSSHSHSSHSKSKEDDLAARRKAFLLSLMKPSSKRGYVNCRLCQDLVWAPNGRYHMEKCSVISWYRNKADEDGNVLQSIQGIRIDEDVFQKPKASVPKPAKTPGFVISRSVDINDPLSAPNLKEQKQGIRTGRKGYVRCVACNAEVFAPNAKHHMANCKKRHLPAV